MNVLITGASGFVGKNLINYLKDESDLSINTLDLRMGDCSISDADVIIHLAGKAHDLRKYADPDEYYQVNYELTKKLYNAFLASKATKFIFMSSVKAAADSLEGVLTENIIPEPTTYYGKSKLMAEEFILNQTVPAEKSYYILRPCMIHGPGNKGNLNLLYNFVNKGLPYPLASFENKRSFLSVENLCFIIKELIDRNDIVQGIYNVADDDALSTNEVVTLLSETLQRTPRLLHLSPKLIKWLARFGDLLKLPLNSERLGKLTENYVVSNGKIREALNKDLPLAAGEGIINTAKGFQKS